MPTGIIGRCDARVNAVDVPECLVSNQESPCTSARPWSHSRRLMASSWAAMSHA